MAGFLQSIPLPFTTFLATMLDSLHWKNMMSDRNSYNET